MAERPYISATMSHFASPDGAFKFHREVTAFSTEINLIWAKENPDLFLKAVADFRDQTEGWGQKINIDRTGFITLHASRHPDYSEPGPMTTKRLQDEATRWLTEVSGARLIHRRKLLQIVLMDMGLERVCDLTTDQQRLRVSELIGLS